MIETEFLVALKKYTLNCEQQLTLWNEVEKNYSKPDRHYHNLGHLDSILAELSIHKGKFDNWDTVIFAIAYHDIVYNTLKNNNEKRSAEIAINRLGGTSFPKNLIAHCERMILATKKHETGDSEINLFTDADLSILGAESTIYKEYAKQIRMEYSIYPDFIYKAARKKVLLHFLAMKNIYKTKDFSDKYELLAKVNIQTELNALTNVTN
jgi:predicted metal-dependent HD superfamily phosphohydrolase